MPDLAGAYAQTRSTMTQIARGLSDEQLAQKVPACPDWTVSDLLNHVTSIAAAVASGSFPPDLNPTAFWDAGMAEKREAFVDEALSSRRGRPLVDAISEWEATSPALESMMRGERPWPDSTVPMPDWIVLTDLAVHHHDLRGAVDQPGDRDSLATGLSLRSYVEAMRFRSMAQNLPAFKIVAGEREWVIGGGEPQATLTADPFDLARAASGRRSPEQLRALKWEGDPEPFLDYFYPYGLRTDPLYE